MQIDLEPSFLLIELREFEIYDDIIMPRIDLSLYYFMIADCDPVLSLRLFLCSCYVILADLDPELAATIDLDTYHNAIGDAE